MTLELCGRTLRLLDTAKPKGVAVPCGRVRGHDGPHHGVTLNAPHLAVQWIEVTA